MKTKKQIEKSLKFWEKNLEIYEKADRKNLIGWCKGKIEVIKWVLEKE